MGLINLSVGDLIAGAGGDPWKMNDELQAGDPAAINNHADAFHAAAGSATEVEGDFQSAKQRFEKGWKHNGTEHPINESAEVTRATTALQLQKPQLAKIALDLETVAAGLATAQRTSDADIAALDAKLHEIDDAVTAAKANDQDSQSLHNAAVEAVRTTLGEIQGVRDGYVATMQSAQPTMAIVKAYEDGANEAGETPGLTPTKSDVLIAAAGAVSGGTADGVRQAALKLIAESPGTGPGKVDPGLLRWLEDPKIGGFELKGLSRMGGVVAAASAVPAVMSDIHDGNSVAEAVTREGVGTGLGLVAGAIAGDMAAGALAGSVVPGAGTAVGLVVGAVVGAGAALGASKGVEMVWHPVADAVGSAAHSVAKVFGFG
ncbi:hypothetical protein A5707_07200 [Mycobacterium kyorinense]|uniref:Predicted hydrolase N-terminal domain-containing protein n=1 Tax=Mycobacterium kyorinense TaxID=487514 RepID=A0A1A2YU69_9MYCO|nr:hypothetical protein A5707_07200 [Mycobacterium kyorinense]